MRYALVVLLVLLCQLAMWYGYAVSVSDGWIVQGYIGAIVPLFCTLFGAAASHLLTYGACYDNR